MRTLQEWENFTREVDAITLETSVFAYFWMAAQEGTKYMERLPHWPETTEAKETWWRDFYTGEKMEEFARPWFGDDASFGDDYNCMFLATDRPWEQSWGEWKCVSYDMSCPCQYQQRPLLRVRGLCGIHYTSGPLDWLYLPMQLPGDPTNILLMGRYSNRIEYDATNRQWTITDAKSSVSAVSMATKVSYVLGKHNWTISHDKSRCNPSQEELDWENGEWIHLYRPYLTRLKLTGCREGEFTCDDGQCVSMEQRCDQVTWSPGPLANVPNCRDKSDEVNCQLLVLENNYNKNVPPPQPNSSHPTQVNISLVLKNVVEVEEVDHSIHLKFQIILKWNETRATYQNLKRDTTLNTLTDEDINDLWLPLVIYDNTHQEETTRLGEWRTTVTVTREGEFTRSGMEEVDEAEIFQGGENTLTMYQTYTHEFQCVYQLKRYPFDTQVSIDNGVNVKPTLDMQNRNDCGHKCS